MRNTLTELFTHLVDRGELINKSLELQTELLVYTKLLSKKERADDLPYLDND